MPFMIRAAVNVLLLFSTDGLLKPLSQWAIDSTWMIREQCILRVCLIRRISSK